LEREREAKEKQIVQANIANEKEAASLEILKTKEDAAKSVLSTQEQSSAEIASLKEQAAEAVATIQAQTEAQVNVYNDQQEDARIRTESELKKLQEKLVVKETEIRNEIADAERTSISKINTIQNENQEKIKQERANNDEQIAQLRNDLEVARNNNLKEVQLVQQQAADNIFNTRKNATDQITAIKLETQKQIAELKKQEKTAKASLGEVEQTIIFKQNELDKLNAAIKDKRAEFTELNKEKGKDN